MQYIKPNKMKLQIAEDIEFHENQDGGINDSVDLYSATEGVAITITTQNCILYEIEEGAWDNNEASCPAEGITRSSDGIIDAVVPVALLTRDIVASTLQKINAKMGTNFELSQ